MSFLYFILGLCPILWLIFALTVLGWPTYKAAFGSLIISVLLSVAIWQQSFLNTIGSLTLAHSRNSQMSFMYGFFFVKFLFFTVVCVVIVI